jgi:hypothetical protein
VIASSSRHSPRNRQARPASTPAIRPGHVSATLVGIIDGPAAVTSNYPLAIFPPSLLDIGDIGVAASEIVVDLADNATATDLRQQLDNSF